MKGSLSLEGKVALVTGAATGIGKACAVRLLESGASVMLSDINLEACENTTASLREQGYPAACIRHDVIVEDDWRAAVEGTISAFDGLDILVNNAGIYVGGTLLSNALKDVQRVHQVNVDSVFLGMKHAVNEMKLGAAHGRGGSIINLSSVAGIVGIPGHTAYGSSKGAVRLYSKHAAIEFARLGYGVRVNSVHPGLIETAMGDQAFDDFVEVGLATDVDHAREVITQMTPLGRLGKADDVANMVVFLASDASSYCTGAEFVVDGGMSAC